MLKELGHRIARYRLNRNLTQAALARQAGVSQRTLVRVEHGQSTQTANLIRILRTLRILENFEALIPAPAAREGRDPGSFNPVERLCYTGNRGMGALEYAPATGPSAAESEQIDVKALVALAGEILGKRHELHGSFAAANRGKSLLDILRVGTSAGGARAKAIITWNATTNEVRSGQVEAGAGFSYWLLKFDGVSGNKDKELEDPAGYGLIEYAYYNNNMALAAGVRMQECRLLEENGRSHFMTRRFDRTDAGRKIHMQSFGAMEHFAQRRLDRHPSNVLERQAR